MRYSKARRLKAYLWVMTGLRVSKYGIYVASAGYVVATVIRAKNSVDVLSWVFGLAALMLVVSMGNALLGRFLRCDACGKTIARKQKEPNPVKPSIAERVRQGWSEDRSKWTRAMASPVVPVELHKKRIECRNCGKHYEF